MEFSEDNYEKFEDVPLIFIYFLIKNKEVVYVGQTTQGYSRIQAHTDKNFDSVYFIRCDEYDLDELESKYVIKYKPIYNKALPPNYFVKINSAVHEINRAITQQFGWLGKHITRKKLICICDKLGFELVDYDGEFYIGRYDLDNIKDGIIIYKMGAPISEIYDIGL